MILVDWDRIFLIYEYSFNIIFSEAGDFKIFTDFNLSFDIYLHGIVTMLNIIH